MNELKILCNPNNNISVTKIECAGTIQSITQSILFSASHLKHVLTWGIVLSILTL